jgi:hypothetical protein
MNGKGCKGMKHIKRVKGFFVGLLLIFSSPLIAQEIQFPLIQALAWIPPAESRLLPPRSQSWKLSISDANLFSFSRDMSVINDMSVFSIYFFYRRGISAVLTFEVSGGLRYVYDAGSDQLIKKVDAALGFSDSGRDIFPEKTIHYKFKNYFFYNRARFEPAPLVLGLAGRVLRSGDFTLNSRIGLGIPLTDQPGLSSHKAYALAGLTGEYARNKWTVSGAVQLAFFRRPGWLINEKVAPGYFQAELKVRWSKLALGTIFRTSPFEYEENRNDGKTIYISFLLKDRFEIGFMEDIPPMDTVPDFAFYINIRLGRPAH